MRGILEKLLMRGAGGFLDAGRQLMVSLPELLRAQRFHFGYLKSPPLTFTEGGGVGFQLRGDFVPQGRECRMRTRIVDDAIPFGIAV